MITNSFDNASPAKIDPRKNENAPFVDACIVTFSNQVEQFVAEHYACEKIGELWMATGMTPIYQIRYNGKKFAFYRTYVGAPACVATIEETAAQVRTDKFLVFGGAGCLDKEIARGKVMVPTMAYRDEGTSYHYAPAADYIAIRNSGVVARFMKEARIPYVCGKTWTTDAFYRETVHNFEARKQDGCISVEMECAAIQAMCDFRGLEYYSFFTGGDLLDAPEWDLRQEDGQVQDTQHDAGHFTIALHLADYITK